jgi:hypothetical protein
VHKAFALSVWRAGLRFDRVAGIRRQISPSPPLSACADVALRTEAGDQSQRQPFVSRG